MRPGRSERSEARVRQEIRDVERFLRELPPHSSTAGREDLAGRLERLRRELHRLHDGRERGADRS